MQGMQKKQQKTVFIFIIEKPIEIVFQTCI